GRDSGRPGARQHTEWMHPDGCPGGPARLCSGDSWRAHLMKRRSFLAAAAAVAGSTTPAPAVEGGKPVRDTPLRSTYSGPEFYDEKELAELRDVLEKRQPFRWYGPGAKPPMKVLTLEKDLAARLG